MNGDLLIHEGGEERSFSISGRARWYPWRMSNSKATIRYAPETIAHRDDQQAGQTEFERPGASSEYDEGDHVAPSGGMKYGGNSVCRDVS